MGKSGSLLLFCTSFSPLAGNDCYVTHTKRCGTGNSRDTKSIDANEETTSKLISPHFFVFALAETGDPKGVHFGTEGDDAQSPLHIRINI